MSYQRENLANELSSILDSTRKEYASCQERDRMEQAGLSIVLEEAQSQLNAFIDEQ